MVETQQGISTFLSFGAKSVKPEILEELLIGRRDDVDFLTKCVSEIANDNMNHQIIVVGQRGMGKTHLLRVLYQRSQVFWQEKKLVIAYFSEEEYGISGYLDFLIRVLNAFIRWYEIDNESLNKQMDLLRETHSSRQIDVAENIITEYIGNRPLLILAENFDTILEALGKDGQGKLRSFLYRHSRTSIIATSQALSPDLGREDRPFYNFFINIYLKKLTYEDSLALLRALAELEKQENVIEHLKGKGIAQVRAVHEMVKGNHRLLVTFYEFLKADTLASLSKIFMKTLNDLKPYYETFIRYLPPLQQKILHYVALSKMPQNGTEIAKNCFIEQKTLSKQLSELSRRNLIDAITDPDDKRNKLYDIAEPLLRISIEIGEHKEGISALFIDFLALYYSFDELDAQRSRFQNMYEFENDPHLKEDLRHEVLARDKAIDLKKHFETNRKWSKAYLEMKEAFKIGQYKSMVELSKKVPESEKDDLYYSQLGFAFAELKKYDDSLEVLVKAYEINPLDYIICKNLGVILQKTNDFSKAVDIHMKAIEMGAIFIKVEDWIPKAEIYNYILKDITFVLQYDQNLSISRVKYLENIIEKDYEMPEELAIAYRYLQIFRRYVLEKEERALLELPKEQRTFFVKEILEKRKTVKQTPSLSQKIFT